MRSTFRTIDLLNLPVRSQHHVNIPVEQMLVIDRHHQEPVQESLHLHFLIPPLRPVVPLVIQIHHGPVDAVHVPKAILKRHEVALGRVGLCVTAARGIKP